MLAPTRKAEIVVFSILRDSACRECGTELFRGNLLRMEDDRPLCLGCADLDHLVFLPSGNTALTRRASKHSTLLAVVVQFSRSRKRYERQGILVDEEALARAEQECLEDADARTLARARAADRRERVDVRYVEAFAQHLGEVFPGCPNTERQSIAEHACQKHSGRVGRSAAAKEFDVEAITLAVRAHIRHCHTSYDTLLAQGIEREDAREAVLDSVDDVFERWSSAPPDRGSGPSATRGAEPSEPEAHIRRRRVERQPSRAPRPHLGAETL